MIDPAEPTANEVANSAFKFLRALLAEQFKTSTEEQAQELIACMDGEVLKQVAENLWLMELCERELAAQAKAPANA